MPRCPRSILDVMVRLRNDAGISFLYITHDLSTAYQICDDIYVFIKVSLAEKVRRSTSSKIPGTRTSDYC